MARLRTIHAAITELKSVIDPGSALSEYWLRNAIKSGEVPAIMAGGRYLVDLDKLINLEPIQIKPAGTNRGSTNLIRSIAER